MGTWAFLAALFLLCLTSESLQGGFGSPNGYRQGYGTSSGLGAGFGKGNQLRSQPGPPAQKGYGAGTGGSVKPQRPGYGNRYRLGAGPIPGAAAQPGFGAGMKPQKPGYGTRMAAGAFPGVGALPGLGGGMKSQKSGFANGNALGAQPGSAVLSGFGAGFGWGGKLQKPEFGVRNGLGAVAFPGAGAQPGLTVQNRFTTGFGGVMKPQKPGYGNRNGMGAGLGYGGGAKPQKSGIGEGTQPQKPGYTPGNGQELPPGYGNGNGLSTQPGPCSGGVIPLLLPRPPTPGVPSDKGGGWSQESQPSPLVQNGKFPGFGGGDLQLQEVGEPSWPDPQVELASPLWRAPYYSSLVSAAFFIFLHIFATCCAIMVAGTVSDPVSGEGVSEVMGEEGAALEAAQREVRGFQRQQPEFEVALLFLDEDGGRDQAVE
ncbi:glycine rich extracellular protein 1 isoform X2 [Marmota marmota marmota]|uniref:glycine rich extracellular protein 1 isoform X2 n=1 Tax=Marmota marmota marmota TaxID=9994 RepID=UPI0020930459|nr:glycine rich extracellular protein 1 isoform X2 [Marmota marmota marmota]